MFTETLFGNTKKALAILGKSHLMDKAYLAGGTACALQIGHRISVVLDFFTPQEFNPKELARSLKNIGKFELDRQSWGTILGDLEKVKFSIFIYKYPALFPFKSLFGINILDLRDIAAMKIDAISTRGIKRDFIDLYFICQKGVSLKEALTFYDHKYRTLASNRVHIQKSLVYFVDAEATAMPRMLKEIAWEAVKKYFENEVRKLARKVPTAPRRNSVRLLQARHSGGRQTAKSIMCYMYVIKSIASGKCYIGSCANVEKRLTGHNGNRVRSTKYKGPFEVARKEYFDTRSAALKREKQLKRYKGGRSFKKLLESSPSSSLVQDIRFSF